MSLYPDISHHHPVSNWASVKANCPFLISKATQGTSYVDATLDSFIAGCESNKIPYWLYTYLNAGNELAQAKFLVSTCSSKVGSYFVGYILDVEAKNTAANVQSALDYLNTLGVKTMIYHMYSQYSTYQSVITSRPSNCAWWEARYGDNDGKYNSAYGAHSGADLHQYTSKGTCAGISGNCDLNRICGTKNEAWFKTPLSSSSASTTTTTTTTSSIMIGSARIDENGKASGGTAGDQLQTSNTNDTAGEVSMQAMYTHSKGWYILRPKSSAHAEKIAELMITACNNPHIGYDQGNRLGVVNNGINTTVDTECDCSSLVREVIKEATGTDPGNFTTANEATMIASTALFNDKVAYVSQTSTPVYNGDVLVTKTKGHTVVVVSGSPRAASASEEGNTSYCGTGIGKAVANVNIHIRTGAGVGYSSLGTITKGTAVEVLDLLDNNWYKIVWPGASCGYAYTSNSTGSYYTYTPNADTPSSSVTIDAAQSRDDSLAGTYTTTANLRLRAGAGTDKEQLTIMPKGSSVKCYGYYTAVNGTKWLYVVYGEYKGFCSSAYLTK